jgi:hypothetical protein
LFGLLLGQARWRFQDEQLAATRSIALLAGAAKGGDVREGVWEPVYGIHDVATMGTKPERPRGMKECERTLLFDWVRFFFPLSLESHT